MAPRSRAVRRCRSTRWGPAAGPASSQASGFPSGCVARSRFGPFPGSVSRRGARAATDSCQNPLLDFGSEPNHHDDDQPSLSRPGGVAVSVLELVLFTLLLAVLLGLVAVVIRRPAATGPTDAVLAALAGLGGPTPHVGTGS